MDTSTGAWRRWIWIFVVVQLVGLVTDAAWHGLLSRGVEPETLAEMVGTTRSRITHFMNKFRTMGLIEYNGELMIRTELLTDLVMHD